LLKKADPARGNADLPAPESRTCLRKSGREGRAAASASRTGYQLGGNTDSAEREKRLPLRSSANARIRAGFRIDWNNAGETIPHCLGGSCMRFARERAVMAGEVRRAAESAAP
jgi:hypothetical protein